MTPPPSPTGMITLFLNGWGVQLPEALLEGTGLKDGDSVSKEVLDRLTT